ncbi:MAG: YhcH/YjgK/YiaL family protein [Bacillota bacterium]|nr:YhcH/YjgK/YiaL family protein [Bacillota bacterium]
MIKDSLNYIDKYHSLSQNLAAAIAYLKGTDFSQLEPGRYAINGDSVYAMVSQYETRPLSEGKWEAHRQYIDIQCVIEGQEQIGYANIDGMQVVQPYDEAKDVLFLDGPADDELVLNAGDFTILWPEDVHRPCIAVDQPASVKKVVVKVRL